MLFRSCFSGAGGDAGGARPSWKRPVQAGTLALGSGEDLRVVPGEARSGGFPGLIWDAAAVSRYRAGKRRSQRRQRQRGSGRPVFPQAISGNVGVTPVTATAVQAPTPHGGPNPAVSPLRPLQRNIAGQSR